METIKSIIETVILDFNNETAVFINNNRFKPYRDKLLRENDHYQNRLFCPEQKSFASLL